MPAQDKTVAAPPEPTSAAGLTVRVWRTANEAAVCSFTGDLDLENLAEARTALQEAVAASPPLLVADLEHLGFCDSSGLNLLLKTRMNATAAGIPFRLAAPSRAITRLLGITGADTVFSLHPSVDEALAAPR
ncbi:STAS domain-containing protein [Kitasatospora sp. A2-31]|uniref:STAS domain-containing protein n=1 Tax=Kitasatospora sp. A2-31 TaxID=2916414 RepID=UPI001EEA2832|nr:STAS domain-containing protein [Kitasatospora sp. A2-31]MCG6498259.1 STAS domain-containing protein [Kitasatospora sp. A2-31]